MNRKPLIILATLAALSACTPQQIADAIASQAAADVPATTVVSSGPVLRWIHEYEPHPGERVNIIMRAAPNDTTWREQRCMETYGGTPDRVPGDTVSPGWGPLLLDVCLLVPAE